MRSYKIYETSKGYNVEVGGGFNFENLSYKNMNTLTELLSNLDYADESEEI